MNNRILNISIPLTSALVLLSLTPATDIGNGWVFNENELHGPAESDGITAFAEVIQRAATLPREEGKALLFATGLTGEQASITGEDRLKALAGRNHADPDLLWDLYKEDGQRILRYLYDTYGVEWMEGLRRTLADSRSLHHRVGFSLCRNNGDGSWHWDCYWLGLDRDASRTALVFG